MWFLFTFSLLVIPPPDIHIDSFGENSLSFTLSMESDVKVTLDFQTGGWVGSPSWGIARCSLEWYD